MSALIKILQLFLPNVKIVKLLTDAAVITQAVYPSALGDSGLTMTVQGS